MGTHMKTTVEIADPLLKRAKREARRRGTTVRALIEEGLQFVLRGASETSAYQLVDCSVAGNGVRPELHDAEWDQMLEIVYPVQR
jgi:hypothetical protein